MKTLGALRTDCDILLVIHRTIIITWARSVVLILSIRCLRNVFTRTCVVGNHIVTMISLGDPMGFGAKVLFYIR